MYQMYILIRKEDRPIVFRRTHTSALKNTSQFVIIAFMDIEVPDINKVEIYFARP